MSNIVFKINHSFTYVYNWFIDNYMVESPVYSMVYIYALRLASAGISPSNKLIADKLNIFESDVVKAWNYWADKKIISFKDNVIEFYNLDNKPQNNDVAYKASNDVFYNPSDIDNLAKNDKNIDSLITIAEKIMGKTLSPNNINILVNIYDKLGLPFEVIITLMQFYSDKSLAYIEKVAISWADKGINSMEKAENELNRYSVYNNIIRFFGVKNRSYTEREKKVMEVWINEYKFPLDIIKIACEKTAANTGKVSMSYAEKILFNWYKNGVKTVEDIEKLDNNMNKSYEKAKTVKPVKNLFNDYTQEVYTDEQIEEILRRKAND